VVHRHLASGELQQVLPDHRCVLPNGELPSVWVIYPNRKLPYRVRTFVTEFQRFLEQAS